MDTATRMQLVAAAVNAAGPQSNYANTGEWSAAVSDLAVQLTAWGSDRSPIAQRIGVVESAKVFSATIMSVRREHASTRGYIILHTGTTHESQDVPLGYEVIRTDRTDTTIGLNMARRVRGLIGHKVLVWMDLEAHTSSTKKTRVIKHIEPLRVDHEFLPKAMHANIAVPEDVLAGLGLATHDADGNELVRVLSAPQ